MEQIFLRELVVLKAIDHSRVNITSEQIRQFLSRLFLTDSADSGPTSLNIQDRHTDRHTGKRFDSALSGCISDSLTFVVEVCFPVEEEELQHQ